MKSKTELKEMAKRVLMYNLSSAYYLIEDGCFITEGLSEKEKEICHEYLTKYGKAMAKAIKEEYYTM